MSKRKRKDKEIKTYQEGFDPKKTQQILFFFGDGKYARIARPIQEVKNSDKENCRRFFLRPDPLYRMRKNIKKDEPNGYRESMDLWVKDIPVEYLVTLDDSHPKTMCFGAFCDWDLEERNPFKDKFEGQLIKRNRWLQKENNIIQGKIERLHRDMAKLISGDAEVMARIFDKYSTIVNDFSEDNEGVQRV